MDDILRIKELHVSFQGKKGVERAVRGVSFTVKRGEIFALVGESGCGKSVTAQSILRLNLTPPALVTAGELMLDGIDLLKASEKEMERVRGSAASMIFQDPLTCLNPTMKVGKQITERLYRKEHMPLSRCREEAVRLLKLVQIPDAELRAEQYPHQFSGGMRQRVMIALALACNPRLLIADEPTTALDVTTQAQILQLIEELRKEMDMAVILITHDIGVVAAMADRVAVMHDGKIVEESGVEDIFYRAVHPYTKALLESLPGLHTTGKLKCIDKNLRQQPAFQLGCSFAESCPFCMEKCLREEPPEFVVAKGHRAACWRLFGSTFGFRYLAGFYLPE